MHTWHLEPEFVAVGIDRLPHHCRGPHFAADSAMALTVLASVVGPCACLTLRNLTVVARTGPATWHLADLGAMLAVERRAMLRALDRLERFGWITSAPGHVGVHLSGSLSRQQIARLHPTIADHYLATPAAVA